jgi:hypothetical protein
MELVNFFRSYPVWAQVIFIACIVVQLCLALLAPREARKVGEQSTNAPAPLSGPQQSASGTGNIQIARATNVHIASAPKERQSPHAEKMASFIVEAQKLRDRLGETPLPVRDHNEWGERVNQYLKANLGVRIGQPCLALSRADREGFMSSYRKPRNEFFPRKEARIREGTPKKRGAPQSER